MTDKYSLAKCEQYGRRLAARLCDQHFSNAPDTPLDGPTVLGFTPIRQLNLFVVRQLLHQWQAEINRLRSPYFNFTAPAVQAALLQFQNILSRHIQLTRPVFEPLLAQATTEALRLATDPASAFARLLPLDSALTAAQLRQELRYLDLNKEFFTAFLDSLPPNKVLPRDEVVAQLQTYQEVNYRLYQPTQQLVAALSALLPLTEADLWQDGPTSASSAATSSAIPTAPAATQIPTPPTTVNPPTVQSNGSSTIGELSDARAPLATPAPALAPTATPLYEKLKATQLTTAPLATTLRAAQPQPAALAERGVPKVNSLREAISINQRFSFINELFNGENMEYYAAIQHIDSLTDYEQAKQYITQNLAQRYDWSRKEEHVAKLLKLLERKYTSI